MGKKRQQPNPPKQPSFRSTPFSALKGVPVPSSLQQKPEPSPVVAVPPVNMDTESDLFFQAMGGVRRLDGAHQAAQQGAETNKPSRAVFTPAKRAEIDPVEQDIFTHAIGQLRLDVTFSDKFPEDDELKPLGANRLRQLKKGVILVDRQLDLHGLTRDEALEALPRFLRNARVHGEKAVLVITGKGINSPGEPVLQQAVAAWMREAGKEFVLEFAPAPREMGGSGAFVVFLREQ